MQILRGKLIASVTTLFLLTSLLSSKASAAASADCIEFSNPRSSAGGTSITLQVDLYSICAKVVREYDNPVYSMVEEDSLFNLASCNGPFIQSAGSLGRMYLGTITCNLRINQYLGSSRTGATSTSIKVWFAWDFSSKQISIIHSAIPKYSSSGSNGNSGSIPIQPSCTSAPSAPTLNYEVIDSGIKFNFAPASIGSSAKSLFWAQTFYDSVLSKWDVWSDWVEITPAASSQIVVPKTINKIKAAFAVYASNACGSSEQSREMPDRTGITFELLQSSLDSKKLKTYYELTELVPMNGFITSSSGSLISYEVSTPEICQIDQDLFLSFQKIGKCIVKATVANKNGYKNLMPIELNFSVNKSATISCVKGKVTKKITGISPVCPSGYKKKK